MLKNKHGRVGVLAILMMLFTLSLFLVPTISAQTPPEQVGVPNHGEPVDSDDDDDDDGGGGGGGGTPNSGSPVQQPSITPANLTAPPAPLQSLGRNCSQSQGGTTVEAISVEPIVSFFSRVTFFVIETITAIIPINIPVGGINFETPIISQSITVISFTDSRVVNGVTIQESSFVTPDGLSGIHSCSLSSFVID